MTDTHRGQFTSAHELLDRLRARQVELGWSNEAIEDMCLMAPGEVNKYLGPGREKFPGLLKVMDIMAALGLAGSLSVDPQRVERIAKQGRRKAAAVRLENPRVSKAMMKRAKPVVLNELRSRGGKARWADVSVEQRSLMMRDVVLVRWNRRRRLRGKHV